jgi:hypothetical protein
MLRKEAIAIIATQITRPISEKDKLTLRLKHLINRTDNCICIATGKINFDLTVEELLEVISENGILLIDNYCQISIFNYNNMVGKAKVYYVSNM